MVLKVQSWLYIKELMELEWYISLPLKIDFILMEILTLAENNRCLHETFSQLWNELIYHPSRQGQSFKSLSTCPDYTIDMYQFQNGLNGLLEIGYLTFLMHENGMASIWIPTSMPEANSNYPINFQFRQTELNICHFPIISRNVLLISLP